MMCAAASAHSGCLGKTSIATSEEFMFLHVSLISLRLHDIHTDIYASFWQCSFAFHD